MSLIEVLVALLVFGILSTGLVAGITTMTRLSADTRARAVASGLAAQDIALARAVGDPFDLADTPSTTTTQTVGSRAYTVSRTVRLVSQTGVDVACNTSDDLFYARVNTRVTWAGQLTTTGAVQDDTIVSSQGRINDSATGSISISVIGADGSPRSGVMVTIVPAAGGSAVGAQPAATDANGCTRVGAVEPGSYTVTLSKTDYVGVLQEPNPSKSTLVTAGTNQSLSFQYDAAARYTQTFVPWPKEYAGAVPPVGLSTTFFNTTGPYVTALANARLHPFASGYTAVAGTPADSKGTSICAAEDPTSWTQTSSGSPKRAAGVRAVGATVAGQTSTFSVASPKRTAVGIPMGVVQYKLPSGTISSGTVFTATTTTSQSGNPSCTKPNTYTFAATTGSPAQVGLLLPYGSYTITYRVGTGASTPANNLSVPTNLVSSGSVQGNVVTVDPRAEP